MPVLRLSVAQLLQIFQVAQVQPVCHTFPDDMRRVRLLQRHPVNAAENERRVHQILHEGDNQSVGLFLNIIVLTNQPLSHHWRQAVIMPILCPRRQQVGAVTLIAPLRMVVLSAKDDDTIVVWQRLRPWMICHVRDAEEREVVLVGGKALALAQDKRLIVSIVSLPVNQLVCAPPHDGEQQRNDDA